MDSIEHYAFCPVVTNFAVQRLHFPHHLTRSLLSFLCLNNVIDERFRVLQLLLLYSVYTATNIARSRQTPLACGNTQELLLQLMHQAAGSFPSAQRILQQALIPEHVKRRRIT